LNTMLHKEIETDLTSHGAKNKCSAGMNTEDKRLAANNSGDIETATGGRHA
jgi:hypothetical protein